MADRRTVAGGRTVSCASSALAGQDEEASAAPGRAFTVVFDGDCTVCTRLSHLLRSWDRRGELEVVSAQQHGVMARYPWIPARAYAEALQLVAADGTTWQGAAAIEKLLDVLPKGRLLSWAFRIPFARGAADRFYKWFARNRYRMGCGAHCQSRPVSFPAASPGDDSRGPVQHLDR